MSGSGWVVLCILVAVRNVLDQLVDASFEVDFSIAAAIVHASDFVALRVDNLPIVDTALLGNRGHQLVALGTTAGDVKAGRELLGFRLTPENLFDILACDAPRWCGAGRVSRWRGYQAKRPALSAARGIGFLCNAFDLTECHLGQASTKRRGKQKISCHDRTPSVTRGHKTHMQQVCRLR